jgi:hypothetical protein
MPRCAERTMARWDMLGTICLERRRQSTVGDEGARSQAPTGNGTEHSRRRFEMRRLLFTPSRQS